VGYLCINLGSLEARRVWNHSPGIAGGATLSGVRVRLAIVAIALGIAGCASAPTTAAYVGEFTGEFVDGVPLYRFPAIEIFGTLRSVDHDL